jgi:hypothetical protein
MMDVEKFSRRYGLRASILASRSQSEVLCNNTQQALLWRRHERKSVFVILFSADED